MSRLPPLFGPATKYDPWHVGSWNSSALSTSHDGPETAPNHYQTSSSRASYVGAMWKPHLNFITLHYAWIILCGLLGLVVLTPEGNIAAIDAYFFGASASTESGLNTCVENVLY
ncbi:hypothetical protein F5883DRAFT_265929 [Diaporthe sp. PMI_573]|nr:hypothetical protein F5883DRAFT_265929 [Diaporthaceae sp. PMI_573]